VTTAQGLGLFLLAVSLILAPLVGRRLDQRNRERASRSRLPSRADFYDQTAYYDDWDNL
jgi:hypothetical protein